MPPPSASRRSTGRRYAKCNAFGSRLSVPWFLGSRERCSMSKMADQDYLLNQQYRDGSNLNARVQLHQRFSTNTYNWYWWVLDQVKMPPQGRVLELGCGPGWLWVENRERIPPGWEITLSDFSPGMIEEA